MSAVCAVRARDRGGPALAGQVLVYPVVDHDFTTASYVEHGGNRLLLLECAAMRWFWDTTSPTSRPATTRRPRRCARRTSRGLPPAIVVIAEYDPLRDEGLAYAERLRDAGVAVSLHSYDDMPHAFFSFVNLFATGNEAVARVGARDPRADRRGRVTELATIGVYGFTATTFIAALRDADVRLVLDVRQRRGVRGSEYAWANAKRLEAALAAGRHRLPPRALARADDRAARAAVPRGRPHGRRQALARQLAPAYRRALHRARSSTAPTSTRSSPALAARRAAPRCCASSATRRRATARSSPQRIAERFGLALSHIVPESVAPAD